MTEYRLAVPETVFLESHISGPYDPVVPDPDPEDWFQSGDYWQTHGGVLHEVDQIMMGMKPGGRVVYVDEFQLREVQAAIHQTIDQYRPGIDAAMTPDWAVYIRELRVTGHFSWRALAAANVGRGVGWEPGSNQLAGILLCEAAAKHFNERSDRPPWNQK